MEKPTKTYSLEDFCRDFKITDVELIRSIYADCMARDEQESEECYRRENTVNR